MAVLNTISPDASPGPVKDRQEKILPSSSASNASIFFVEAPCSIAHDIDFSTFGAVHENLSDIAKYHKCLLHFYYVSRPGSVLNRLYPPPFLINVKRMLRLTFIFEDMIGNDDPLYFRCAFINGKHAGISIQAFNGIVFGKPIPAMNL